MKTPTLFHCSDPQIGHGPSTRSGDRLAALARFLDAAVQASADAVLITGKLLAPGQPAPSTMSGLEATLVRARAGGVGVWTTCEHEREGWLEYLVERELLDLLAVHAEGPLPVAEPRHDFRIIGLGRPTSLEELAERAQRLPVRRGDALHVVLIDTPFDITAGPLPKKLRAETSYIAIGGSEAPIQISAAIRDPGPLTRLDLTRDDESHYVQVTLRPARPAVKTRTSSDRELAVIRLNRTELDTMGAIETELRAARSRFGVTSPLVRLELGGTAGKDHNDEAILDLAKRLLAPADIVLVTGDDDTTDLHRGRDEIERTLLRRLSKDRAAGFSDLATSVFERLTTKTGDDAAAETSEEIYRFIDASATRGKARRRATD